MTVIRKTFLLMMTIVPPKVETQNRARSSRAEISKVLSANLITFRGLVLTLYG